MISMDNEFCEIDFTTATSWENFTARLEEIFYSWKLYQSQEEFSSEGCSYFSCEYGNWFVKTERINFDDKEFEISYYRRQTAQWNPVQKNDENPREKNKITNLDPDYFPLKMNCLSKNLSKCETAGKLAKLIRLYDLQNFVVLIPSLDSASITSSESYVKFLLSSFCMSAFNTRCFIPIFTQVYQSWQSCFIGLRVDEDGFRIDYQMIHLSRIPYKFHYFSGLVDMLKSKIPSFSFTNSIWASVKLSYSISNFVNFAYPPIKQDVNVEESGESSLQDTSFQLPFGAACEPITEIRLHVAWPKVFENMVMDNEHHSDFDPLSAPNWALQISEKESRHLLSQNIMHFLQACQSTTPVSELIGDLLRRKHFNPGDLNVPSQLSLSKIIAGGNIGNNNINNDTKRLKKFLPEETLVSMLYYLFPDADTNNTHPYLLNSSDECKEDIVLKGMKTCAVEELPWRLSIIMSMIIHLYGEYAAAQFWYEFVEELRFRWDKCVRLLGVQKGVPNHKTSLINQKLQMLNCCIQKKSKRENIELVSEDSDDQNDQHATKGDSEDEEFFDCQTETKEYKDEFDFNTARVSLWNQPEGRLRKFNNLKLIETGDFMYIPITQEMTPKTEDQLEDDAVVLMKLGSDSEGSKLRARMMCASLYSDMESFKAANPGAILEDFIRWYSPRDWIESSELDQYGQKKGKLSHRMQLPGNMWKEVWDTSIPVPACRQKCLFDDRKESEKVLHFFESHKYLADVFSHLLPTLVHAAVHTIINDKNVIQIRQYSSYLDEKINAMIQKAVSATRSITLDISQYKVVADEISEIEDIVCRFKSLELKLFPVDLSQDEKERKILMELVFGERQIILPNGPKGRLGSRIIFLFSKERREETSLDKTRKDVNDLFMNTTNEFLHSAATTVKQSISSHNADQRTIPANPYQKEFGLHVSSALPCLSSRVNAHNLTAHICNEEILIATSFTRDSIFV